VDAVYSSDHIRPKIGFIFILLIYICLLAYLFRQYWGLDSRPCTC
jgi:hypothetical protein